MIHRNFSENIKIAPKELERELWNMNTTEQTDFLLAMSQRYRSRFDDSIIRYKFLKREMYSCLTKEERDNIMNMLKMLITHLRGE